MNADIPRSHPRYESLKTRERMKEALSQGIVHETGLIAHGRGEAFDYLLGEVTIRPALEAEKVAVAALLLAHHPVISINGNVVALAAEECVHLARMIPAKIEVNLFHRTEERVRRLVEMMTRLGAQEVYGLTGDARIPGLEHDRGRCDSRGIFTADVVLVPLEDGDRCQALKKMNKTVIAIDLNPLSRTARTADITIVDEVRRSLKNMEEFVMQYKTYSPSALQEMVSSWDNTEMLRSVLQFLSKRLNAFF
jgi:4-phosphopantoate--beta-alanine ligase